ncbi:MAG TPA: GNAT family N-acetyltransferase, partial [Cellvibrio sp.]
MSGITVSTEKVTDELLAEVADLYVVEQYKKSLWAWQFSHRFERDVLAIVARDNGRVVGFNGTMPIKIVDEHDQKIDAIWSCDFIVAPDYRGKGLGKAIKDEMAKAFTMPVMSLGISDSAFP